MTPTAAQTTTTTWSQTATRRSAAAGVRSWTKGMRASLDRPILGMQRRVAAYCDCGPRPLRGEIRHRFDYGSAMRSPSSSCRWLSLTTYQTAGRIHWRWPWRRRGTGQRRRSKDQYHTSARVDKSSSFSTFVPENPMLAHHRRSTSERSSIWFPTVSER